MAVSRQIRKQLDRLERCFFLLDLPMTRRPGATEAEIDRIERETGISVDDDLKSMWRYSNGSGAQPWFICDAVETQRLFTEDEREKLDAESFADSALTLYSIDEVLGSWSFFKDVDETNPNGWATDTPDSFAPQVLDKRIGPQMLRHRRRLPFGTLFELSDEVLFDVCPSNKGRMGQVLRYYHDPDTLKYVVSSFAAFFDRSLYWFETVIPRNPDKAREVFEDQQLRKY
jgi:cell wall assembly regulator SMI1